MKSETSRLCVQTSFWVLASALCVATLAGCSATSDLTSSLGADTPVQGLTGTVHGGPNPVTGATVTLYATKTTASPSSANNYGYGQAGQSLGSTTTDSNGNFSFSSPTACPAGQQAYIVSAGGKTGTNSTNSAAVLMAALGPCSSLVEGTGAGHTTVIIDEPTTIAAAYALSGFMTTTGNGSSAVVNISAPANNNATTASCTTNGSKQTTACAASGLAHAFLNAASLVNSTTGAANSTFTSGSTITVTVPQMLINTLANSVEACVNSSGSLVSPAPCATLMTNATPTQVTSPTAPTNTLQALLDLALYPSEAAGATTAGTGTPPTGGPSASAATTALFNVANSNAYYAPALTAAPFDFSIAINYVLHPPTNASLSGGTTEISLTVKGTTGYTTANGVPTTTSGSGTGMVLNVSASSGALTGGYIASPGTGYAIGDKIFPTEAGSDGTAYFTVVTQGAGAPWGVATDIKDNVYLYVVGAVAGGPASPSVYSLTSNGVQNWITATGTGGGCGTTTTRCSVTPDTLGNMWVTDSSGLTQMNAISGALGTNYPYPTAASSSTAGKMLDSIVDEGNNVWIADYGSGTYTGASALEELPQGASAIADVSVGGAPLTSTSSLHDLAFDTAGNLWAASDAAAGVGLGAILMISSNNSLTSPQFNFTSTSNPQLYLGGAGAHSWDPMIDISGNVWIGSETELNEVTSGGSETGGATLYNTSYTLIYGPTWEGGVERYATMDGAGNIEVDAASGNFGFVSVYYTNAPSDGKAGTGEGGADTYLNPCFVATSTTVCAETSEGSSQIVNASRGVAVDAAGSVWFTLSSGLNVIQLLGPGTPTWSQGSYQPLAFKTNTNGRPY